MLSIARHLWPIHTLKHTDIPAPPWPLLCLRAETHGDSNTYIHKCTNDSVGQLLQMMLQ